MDERWLGNVVCSHPTARDLRQSQNTDKMPFAPRDIAPGDLYAVSLSDICEPPCKCADCTNSFYLPEEQINLNTSYRGKISDHDARRIAAQHVRDMQQEREYLVQRLASHADVLMNRWKKKSIEKRHSLLVDVVPELGEHRWAIPRFISTTPDKHRYRKERAARRQFLLPWLSVEVLKANPAVLFGLLHCRTTYPPQDWAPYDNMQLIISWASGFFDVEYTDKCVIMYGPRYGELVDWQAGPAHRADIMGFPRARLVLEAQAYLMGGLRKIVDKIMDGADMSKQSISEKWRLVTSLGFKQTGAVEIWSPYTNQGFSAPPVFNINNLISIVQTRSDAVSDHLWLLQTEPAYMRRYIRIVLQGDFHRICKPDEVGSLVVKELYKDVVAYWMWRWVSTEFAHVKAVHDRFRDSVHPGERLPPRYDRALGALELLLVNLVKFSAAYLSEVLPYRPGFRDRYSFSRCAEANGTISIEGRREKMLDVKKLFFEDPLEWCLVQMQGASDTQSNFDHAMLFAFLDSHLANSTPKERARVDEILYRKLSDLAAYHEILISVRLHRPQNEIRNIEEVKESEDRGAWKGFNIPVQLGAKDSIRLGTPLLRDFYEAPVPGGLKNIAWLKRSQALRKSLEKFWGGMRRCSQDILKEAKFSTEEALSILNVTSAYLTPEYVAAVRAEEEQVLAGNERASEPLQKEWGSSSATQSAEPAPKAKIKTKVGKEAEPMKEIEEKIAGVTVDFVEESYFVVPVKRRAFDMITLMFPSTAQEAAKSVEWDNFVYAMSDIGFAARNGGGSAVLFANEGWVKEGQSGGKIVFHKPHPIAKIDPIMLHSMGKRMAKWFGWSRERFALES